MKKIVLSGGPGSGKTSLIQGLKNRGFHCFDEVSRKLINSMKITTSFKPLDFEENVFNLRKKDFLNSSYELQFFDRSIIDNLAYLKKNKQAIPQHFEFDCKKLRYYPIVFIAPPWQSIYLNDNERIESFEEAQEIHQYLCQTYSEYNYQLLYLPKGNIEERIEFILSKI